MQAEKLILEKEEKSSIKSHIYIIKNKINDKVYVGQSVSHRLNKNKYRYFGYIGRFKDHISEAVNNTKKKQCSYLNNAIRKYGTENFFVELIEICDINNANEREIFHIENNNCLFPNGYNLTTGGKVFKICDNENDKIYNTLKNEPKTKRGRDFGYQHKDDTKIKMKNYYDNKKNNIEFQNNLSNKMKNNMRNYYDRQKIEELSKYNLQLPLEKYIIPIYKKNTNIIHNYRIIVNKKTFKLKNNDTTEEKYNHLLQILKNSYDNGNNCNDHPKGE